MMDLGTFGGTYSTAASINSVGEVVGYALTGGGEARGFLFHGGALLDLNVALSSSQICTNLISADAINDQGLIAGSGYNAAGEYHAFLLIPGLILTNPSVANGQFKVTVRGTAGQRFAVEASSNLVNWISLDTNTFVTNSFEWSDAGASGFINRFYRALLSP